MTVKELKRSLSKIGTDFDDYHIIIQYLDSDGKKAQDLLVYTGYFKTIEAFALGTYQLALHLKKTGEISDDTRNE